MFGPFWNLYDKTNLSFIFLLKEKYKDLIKNIINKNSWGWNVTHLCTQPIPKNACACMYARSHNPISSSWRARMRQATRSHERTRTPARISTTRARMHAYAWHTATIGIYGPATSLATLIWKYVRVRTHFRSKNNDSTKCCMRSAVERRSRARTSKMSMQKKIGTGVNVSESD